MRGRKRHRKKAAKAIRLLSQTPNRYWSARQARGCGVWSNEGHFGSPSDELLGMFLECSSGAIKKRDDL